MITRRSALALPLVLAAAPAVAHHDHRIDILDPWARAGLKGRNGAAYMTLVNPTDTTDRLVAVSTDVARVAELHTHLHENGVMRMRPVQAIEVNVGEPAVLRPGGLHIMLIGLTRDLREGERITLTLRFEKAGEKTVQVPVLSAGASGPRTSGHPAGGHTH